MALKRIYKKDLNIASENEWEIWAYCPAHDDKHRPNLYITKDNAVGYCFGCGFTCKVLGLNANVKKVKKPKANVNWADLQDAYTVPTKGYEVNLNKLAKKFGVDISTIMKYGVGWNGSACTIPIYNELGCIIGMQRRWANGQNRVVKGSGLGIFMNLSILRAVRRPKNDFVLLITEGFSDATVATYLGFPVIGRISCTSSTEVITRFIGKTGITNIILIADNDDAGKIAAEKLVKKLKISLTSPLRCDIILSEKGKDLREMYEQCGYEYTKKWIQDRINLIRKLGERDG